MFAVAAADAPPAPEADALDDLAEEEEEGGEEDDDDDELGEAAALAGVLRDFLLQYLVP